MNTKKIDEIAIRTFNQAHPPGSKVYYEGRYREVALDARPALLGPSGETLPAVWLADPGGRFLVPLCDLGDPT